MAKLSAPHFTDEKSATLYLEALRWPAGPVCPHCGVVDKAYATKRPGKYRCATRECRKDFTVKVGTVFESSHIPLHKWLLAAYLLCSSKKGMSSHQLHRTLDVTYKTAWFMTHRIREAMRTGSSPRWAARARWSRPTKPTSAARRAPKSVAVTLTSARRGQPR